MGPRAGTEGVEKKKILDPIRIQTLTPWTSSPKPVAIPSRTVMLEVNKILHLISNISLLSYELRDGANRWPNYNFTVGLRHTHLLMDFLACYLQVSPINFKGNKDKEFACFRPLRT
jgi:hypothetical protein